MCFVQSFPSLVSLFTRPLEELTHYARLSFTVFFFSFVAQLSCPLEHISYVVVYSPIRINIFHEAYRFTQPSDSEVPG